MIEQNNDHPWQIATPIFKQSHCHHQTAPFRSPVYSSTVAFTQCRKPSLTISLGVYGCIPNKKPLFGMVYYLFYIPLTCSLGCFTKHFIEKIGYKMVLRQPKSRQQVGTLYEMTSPSSLWNASPQTTRVQRHAARHRATTQLSSIKCCSNLGVVSEALLQYGKTYVYKMPFPPAVGNPSDLIQWRSDVQLVWL